MQLPFFYIENIDASVDSLVLDEDNSRHIISVLRMAEGEALHFTNGKGILLTAAITDTHKKKCRVQVTGIEKKDPAQARTGIGISLVKNPARFEWFLEKATEIGITDIIPLICARTEKQHFRYDRMKNVLVSAMLQSRQTWMPGLQEPVNLDAFFKQDKFAQQFIAHCLEEDKQELAAAVKADETDRLILIGPEGDFTADEIKTAIAKGFIPVALGNTRLRTETAGIAAAVLLRMQAR